MKRTKKCIRLSFLAIALLLPPHTSSERAIDIAPFPLSPTSTEITGDQWLFVIGIDTYIHWPRLQTAVSDAKSVRDVLLSRYYYDKDHLFELYDEQATRKNILARLHFLANHVSQDDPLLIFYVGHWHLDPITKEGSWIPVESGTKDVSAWISNHGIKNYLRVDAIKAKHILLISDSCFLGDFFPGRRAKLRKIADEVIKPLTDKGFGRNSVSSHFLTKTLKQSQRPFLVSPAFCSYIEAGLPENAEQFSRFDSLKATGDQKGGELLPFLRQDPKLKDLSAKAEQRETRSEQLRRPKKAAKKVKRGEAGQIARYVRKLLRLSKKIRDMDKYLSTPLAKEDDGPDAMLAMARQKEEQQRGLEGLNKKRQQEKARRRAEVERIKKQKSERLIASPKEHIRKYREIISSPFGKGIKRAPWKTLVAKYPEAAEHLEIGDPQGLTANVIRANTELAFTNSIGMKFVLIPAGTFTMGSPLDEPGRDSDETQHRVTLSSGFYMQTAEVTQGQWQSIMATNPSHFWDCGNDCPVEWVSWNDTQDFIKKLNQKERTDKYRLPTEAEWEFACRARTMTSYSWGDQKPVCKPGARNGARFDDDDECHDIGPAPVRTYSPNSWGLYDMHGNVWEWCQDWYTENYPTGHVTDPKGPSSGRFHVLRGGGWGNDAGSCRCALRNGGSPDLCSSSMGFRVVRDFWLPYMPIPPLLLEMQGLASARHKIY